MIIRGHHYRTEEWIDINIESDRIVSVGSIGHAASPALTADIIAPAYFDLQINGGLGVNFTSTTLGKSNIERVVQACHERGIASFCPTVITAAQETIQKAFTAIATACDSDRSLAKAMPCFHLEGPYISPDDGPRGAHPRAHVRHPNWDEFRLFQEASGGRIKLVTLAPEVSGAIPFIEKLAKEEVVVAIGHSAGPPSAIRDAIHAGARLSTHLGNGCHQSLPRHENIIWEQLAADELLASFITDGQHLPWNLVRCILRSKSLARSIITCDASPLAGLPSARYSFWGQDVEVLPEGKIVLPNQNVLAGSWDYTHTCVEKLVNHLDLTYAETHALAADQPRLLLGLPVPTLKVGQPADLVLLHKDKGKVLKHIHSIISGNVHTVPARAQPSSAAAH